MKSYKKLLIAVVLIGLGLGVSGCKYEYDPDQIYTKHKNACEFSIRSIENNSPMMVVGEFLYNDGVCKCKENECSVGEVCYEKFDGDIICVDYMCNDGERKCVSGKGGAYIYGCSELNWKLEKICGGENESGRCNADKTDCEKCDGNVGGCEPTETIDCEPECIWVASNEFGHEYYEYKSCDKNGNPEKPKKCAFKCNDKIENGELGCVDCEKNECRDDKSLNVCDNGEFYVTTCPNGCSDGECKCNDGDVRCSGIDVQSCRDGKWITDASCSNGCSEGKCKVDCDDGDVKCDEDKYMICSGGNWDVSDECGESGCFYDENNKVMCKCTDQHLKCEGGELWKCFNGKWHARGGKDKWPGTNTNVMGMEMEENCVCKTNGEVDQLTTKEVFESICNFCFEDTSAQGYYYGNNNTNGSSECRDIASGKLLSCKADFSGCGECLNDSKICGVTGASVLQKCVDGSWKNENCPEGEVCRQTVEGKTNAECVKFGEVCKNECIDDVAYVCIDNVKKSIDCSKGCELNNGVLLCAGCAESHKNGNDFRCVDCIDKSDCGDGYVCEENNCKPTIDSMCQSVSCINDGNGIGELQCSDNRTVKCDNASCNRNVCGECLNRNTRCRDGKLQTCVEGKWGNGMACLSFSICEDNGDGKAKCVGGSGNVCTDGEKKCSYQYDTQNNTGTKIVVIRQNCIQGAWHGATASPNVLCDNSIVIDGESRCVSEINLNGQIVSGVIGYNYNNISGLSFEDCGDLRCLQLGKEAACGGCNEYERRCGTGKESNTTFVCKEGRWEEDGVCNGRERCSNGVCTGTGNIGDETCEDGMYKCANENSSSANGTVNNKLYKCVDRKWENCDKDGKIITDFIAPKSECLMCKSEEPQKNINDVWKVLGEGGVECMDGYEYTCKSKILHKKQGCSIEEY